MTKIKLGLAAGVAAVLAFGVAACGQTTATTEPPAAEAPAEPAAVEAPPADAVAPAADAAAPADPAAAPADPAAPAPTTP